jgi:2,3-dihydroxyphenylpropionate 1,2-dioxygenase
MTSFSAVCAAHAPLALNPATPAPQRDEYLASLRRCGEWIRELSPDLLIEFAPDHLNSFFYNLMPSFCIGVEAISIGDWGTPKGCLTVPTDLALGLLSHVRRADVDLALSYRMTVDHGFTQLLALMFGGLTAFPIIPIMLNCAAPPLPNFRRIRLLGEAVGNFCRERQLRVVFLGSGGLSHDPPIPKIEGVDPARRDALISGADLGPEARAAREGNVIRAAQEFSSGKGASLAPNEAWDRAFMTLMSSGDIRAVDAWEDDTVRSAGGNGGHEVRAWVASFAALQAAKGAYRTDIDFYEVVPEWMTGMGIIRAW